MTAIKARKCFVPPSPSDWVAKVFLTCDNMLAVQFKHGQKVKKILDRGPGAYLGYGGAPSVCCLYPGTQGERAETLYELAHVWPFAGEWVHAFLYKKFGYVLVSPPRLCGGCNTSCSLSINPANPTNGQAVTIYCTVTNTDGSPTKGAVPQGSVAFSVDGTEMGSVSLPDSNPYEQNAETVNIGWTATCTPSPIHAISAVFTPADSEFTSTNCSMNVTVSGCGVPTSCCPNELPSTLHATISNVSGCSSLAGTYPLTWNASTERWEYGNKSLMYIGFYCNPNIDSPFWYITIDCTGSPDAPLEASSADCNIINFAFYNYSPNTTCCAGSVNIAVTA